MGGQRGLADSRRGLGAADASGRESMISRHHLVAAVGNIHTCEVVLDVYPREAFTPEVQRLVAAVEAAQVVAFGELLDDEFGVWHHQRLSATEPRPNRRFSPGGIRGLASSALTNAFHALGCKTK
jgi:hypothetical protein